jgi:CRISPR/Cas system-associated endoribonuclease Cas2
MDDITTLEGHLLERDAQVQALRAEMSQIRKQKLDPLRIAKQQKELQQAINRGHKTQTIGSPNLSLGGRAQ